MAIGPVEHGGPIAPYPDRPIRWILSHPPGGSADVIARLMQPKLEKLLGQPLIIENRAGAGGIIAMDALSKAKPDGYTIHMGASGFIATSPALGETVQYDPLKWFSADRRDLGPALHAGRAGELNAEDRSAT